MNKNAILLPLLFLLALAEPAFAAFEEFYARSDGSNLNSGHTTNAVSTYTATASNWDSTTGVFAVKDGSTPASTVTNGAWASVYADGASVGVYVGRVTNVTAGVNGSITIDISSAAGAAPTTSTTSNRTVKVGGAFLGMNAASGYPLNMANLLRMTNAAGDRPRFNFKNDTEYKITAAVSCAGANITIQGYATTPGDRGKATLSGNTVAAAFVPLTLSGNMVYLGDFIVSSNGNSSTASALVGSGSYQTFENVVVNNSRGVGFFAQGIAQKFIGCEAYSNGVANTALDAGFRTSGGSSTLFLRCISHDNTGANIAGWHLGHPADLVNCVADSNGTNGVTWGTGSVLGMSLVNCDLYNNGGHGLELKGTAADSGALYVENSNFIKNALWGIQFVANNSNHVGVVQFCGFGAGTQANGSGTVTTSGFGSVEVRTSTFVTYTANSTPWTDPANGDFRVNLAAAKNAGLGRFAQTQASYSGTTNSVDIGAAEVGTTGGGSFVFAQ